ncbi:unnamed protein product [Caenorhabditis brenneri]
MAFDCFSMFPCFLSNICATVYALFTLNFFASSNTGFGSITAFGIIPYPIYWYYGKGSDISIVAYFLFNICTTTLFMIFINPYTPEHGLDQNRREKYHKISLVASISVFVIYMITTQGAKSSNCMELQTMWTIANHGFYADFLIAITDGVRHKDDEIFGRSQVSYGTESVKPAEEPEKPEDFTVNSEELECKVCYRFYSDKIRARAPLVLTSCGHSLCRECCEVILKKEKNFNVCCPTCRKYTYVKNSVNVLPKNEAILAMVKMAYEQVEGGQE